MLRNPGLRKSVEQPVLDLNFAASQIGSNGAPDARMNDFNRGSNAWFVDSDGLVKKSPHNLILSSETIVHNSSGWLVAGGSLEASAEAPDGIDGSTKVTWTGTGQLYNLVSGIVAGQTYRFSYYVKLGTKINNRYAVYDHTNSAFIISSSITSGVSSSEWTRVNFTVTAPSGCTQIRFYPDRADSGGETGTTFITGVQVSQHTTLPVGNPYIKTEGSAVYAARLDHDPTWFMSAAQEQNLLRYSEMLDDSAWYKIGVIVTADATTDPLGGTTAERVEENTTTGSHVVYASLGNVLQVTSGTTYTLSAYVKADELDKIRLQFSTTHFPTQTADFDLSAESVATTGSVSASITDSGNGWYRCAITATADGTGQNNANLWLLNAAGQLSYTGANNGLFIWGVQIEVGSTASTYHRTEGAPYYGEGAAPKGLLIEEARTNDATQSEIFAAQNGCTIVSNNNLAPDGTTTADTATLDTTTGSKQVKGSPNPINTNSISYALSVFAKLINGTPNLAFRGYGNGSFGEYPIFDLANKTAVRSGTAWSNAKVEDYGNGWLRCSAVTTTSNTNGPLIQFLASGDETGTSSYTGNGTDAIAFWGLQQEVGSFPTSYIQTTGTTLTRNADVAVMGPTTGGTELVTNGTFDTDSDWTLPSGGNVTIASGVLDYSSAAQYKRTIQSLASSLAVGRRYRASFEVTSFTSGLVALRYFENGSLVTASDNRGAVGTTTFDFTCTTLTGAEIDIRSQASGSNTFQIDNVSVRELYPFEQYNPAEGTLYAEADSQHDATIIMLNQDGTSNPRMELQINSSGLLNPVVVNSSGSGTLSHNLGSYTAGANLKVGFALKEGSYASSDNGDNVVTGAGSAIEAVDELSLGSRRGTSRYMNGHLKRVLHYSRRLPDETLEALTDD